MNIRPRAGQALIEAAVTIPILVVLFLGFLAAGLAAQALVDLNTSVFLAAASAVTAPAGNSTLGGQYASATYTGSMSHVPELNSTGGVNCGGSWNPNPDPPGYVVTCSASATLLFSRTPLGIVVPFNPVLSATATAHGSPYRST